MDYPLAVNLGAAFLRRGSAESRFVLCRRPAKPSLRADVLRERARSGHHPSFDFNLLRLAIKLMQQVVNHRDKPMECRE